MEIKIGKIMQFVLESQRVQLERLKAVIHNPDNWSAFKDQFGVSAAPDGDGLAFTLLGKDADPSRRVRISVYWSDPDDAGVIAVERHLCGGTLTVRLRVTERRNRSGSAEEANIAIEDNIGSALVDLITRKD